MKNSLRTLFYITLIVLSGWFQVHGVTAPNDVSSLATAKGYLFAGTFGGKIFVSPDSGASWSDLSSGLCDTASLRSQKWIKCINVTGEDSIHAITGCGEFVTTTSGLHWVKASDSGCQTEYCQACMMYRGQARGLEYSAHVNSWIIAAGISGLIEWSPDSGKAWTISDSGCGPCSAPVITSIHFDTISALLGCYYSCIMVSIDSGRTWHVTSFTPVNYGVYSIVRIGSIAFAGTVNGIYASRDNFTTFWLLGQPSQVKRYGFPAHDESLTNYGKVREFSLTGKLLSPTEQRRGNRVVIECRIDANGRSVNKIVVKVK